jgi:hypothetical protein
MLSQKSRKPTPEPVFSAGWSLPGIRAQGGEFRGVTYEQIVVSFWFTICTLALAPAIRGIRFLADKIRKARWRQQGRCLNRGYDLRGLQEKCPECGTPILNRESSTATVTNRGIGNREV